MKKYLAIVSLCIGQIFFAQSITENLDQAVKILVSSDELFAGNLSFYVADNDGNLVYDYHANKGLSTASTMKIFTAAAALEVLGKNYQYTTKVALDKDLIITSNGDPSLGSSRYDGRKPDDFIQKLIVSLKNKNITQIQGDLIVDDSYFDFQKIPGGWPFNDLGNYYGAGVWGLNWRENQFDIYTEGNQVKKIALYSDEINCVNDIRTEGAADKSIIYTAPYARWLYLNGTLPDKEMKISGATPNPPRELALEIANELKKQKIEFNGKIIVTSELLMKGEAPKKFQENQLILEYKSPPLEKLVYWFLKKSINLYGETFVKTMAKEKTGNSSFEVGVKFLKNFWKEKGIDERMINFVDGSGLSPQNYASAKSEVLALLWAKKQAWFSAYYDGFPVMGNGMKMKSGSIKDCRAFAGYHTSGSGKNYVFAIIVNNYQGKNMSDALYKVLNVLK